MLFCVISYFSVFFSLSLFHAFWNPLQPGFIHSESFPVKVIYSSHITKSKMELPMIFFLGLSAALDHVDHILLENLFIWFFAHLTAYPLVSFADFVHLLIMHVGGPQGPCPLARLLTPFMRWWFLSQTSFPWLSLVWLVSLPLPSKTSHSPKPIKCNWLQD